MRPRRQCRPLVPQSAELRSRGRLWATDKRARAMVAAALAAVGRWSLCVCSPGQQLKPLARPCGCCSCLTLLPDLWPVCMRRQLMAIAAEWRLKGPLWAWMWAAGGGGHGCFALWTATQGSFKGGCGHLEAPAPALAQ
jgi:hypothetical protein